MDKTPMNLMHRIKHTVLPLQRSWAGSVCSRPNRKLTTPMAQSVSTAPCLRPSQNSLMRSALPLLSRAWRNLASRALEVARVGTMIMSSSSTGTGQGLKL